MVFRVSFDVFGTLREGGYENVTENHFPDLSKAEENLFLHAFKMNPHGCSLLDYDLASKDDPLLVVFALQRVFGHGTLPGC